MRVLLVEDEPTAAQVLAKGLREQAYAVDVAGDGETALFQVGTTDYDAVILDVMLPGKDGLAVCRSVRASGCTVPILMLTARDTVESRIEGLDCGADDYVTKPFEFGELLARLRALIRRGRNPLLPERLSSAGSSSTRAVAACGCATARSPSPPRNTRCSSIWRAAPATSSAAPTSPSTSGTSTTTRSRTWSTSTFSGCVASSTAPGRGVVIRTRRGEGYQLLAESDA